MNEFVLIIPRILSQVRSAWRFRWYGAAVAWVGCLLGWGIVAFLPPVYEATASVYVDTSSVLKPILSNQIVPPDVLAELTYVHQMLLGREHLERVARENGLDRAAETPAQMNSVLSRLLRGIQIQTQGVSNTPGNLVAEITYRNADREKAIGVVQTLLTSLVEGTLGQTREGADTANKFLDERIAEYEARLQRAEHARAEFKKANAARLPGAEGGYFERIRAERDALESTQKALRLAESKAMQLREQLNSSSPVMPSGADAEGPPPNSIDARIRDYRRELDRLLLEYTDKHPDVVARREALSQLEQQRAEQLRSLGVMNSNQEISALESSPVYQALQIALNDTQVEIATLEADVREREQTLAELQALVNEVPEVEAELARLNRDYDVVYMQYQNLIRSRELQDLTEKATDTDQIEFRVINPPLADFEPVAPNRPLLLSGVLVAMLGAGAALCWALAQLRPVFNSSTLLRESLGFPVLGVVTQAFQRRHKIRRALELFAFAAIMGGLSMVFLLAVAYEFKGRGIHALVVGV